MYAPNDCMQTSLNAVPACIHTRPCSQVSKTVAVAYLKRLGISITLSTFLGRLTYFKDNTRHMESNQTAESELDMPLPLL